MLGARQPDLKGLPRRTYAFRFFGTFACSYSVLVTANLASAEAPSRSQLTSVAQANGKPKR